MHTIAYVALTLTTVKGLLPFKDEHFPLGSAVGFWHGEKDAAPRCCGAPTACSKTVVGE
jgi:hypothetical protein